MVALRFFFPAGRYHATPWGHHVNEGLVEWPPSPWRLLRALVAVGFTRRGWTEETIPVAAHELVETLASSPPAYILPKAVASHTRHYMPIGTKTTKVIDTFAHIGEGVLWVEWTVELGGEARGLLEQLAEALPYLGRAESWVECSVHDGLPPGAQPNAVVGAEGDSTTQLLRTLAAATPSDYERWRGPAREEALRGLSKAKKKKIEHLFPSTILETLLASTSQLQAAGWTRPLGSREVIYQVPSACLSAEASPPTRIATGAVERPQFALLAVTGDSRNGTLRPQLSQSLAIGELLHFSIVKKLNGLPCPELVGRGDDGQPMRGHQHAHLMSMDLDRDGRIDHILVWAPMGLGENACHALALVRRTYDLGHDRSAFLTLAGFGTYEEMERLLGGSERNPLRSGRCWQSVTPFIAPRYIKAAGKNTLERQVASELAAREISGIARIVVNDGNELASLKFHQHVRARRARDKGPPATRPWHLTLYFETPRSGPLVLGYGSHLGLGQFQPVPE